jgi:predicted dehydrogenase
MVISAGIAPRIMSNSSVNDSRILKIGLIGCGGRGTGAAHQALSADEKVVITAMADVFEDKMQQSLKNLKDLHPAKVKVDKSNQFLGFDAWRKLIETDVDVILLATPPAFRPDHLQAAIRSGKHVFCEKPMAVDASGIRKVLAAADLAKQKKLSLVSGFCWRYHFPKRAIFEQVHKGAVGKINTVYNTYNTGALWHKPKQPDWNKLQYEMRNWIYYNWLSGDHIAEQAVHSLDMMAWAMKDALPLRATGTGGRQSRTDDKFGNVFDHFAIVFEYPENVKGIHFSRQQKNCSNSYAVQITGSEGNATIDCIKRQHIIVGKNNWRYDGEENNMYQTEHDELFASIRDEQPINDGKWMAQSTMLAILGRMAAYSGKTITWDEAIQSTETLGPDVEDYHWEMDWPMPPVAKPGIND